MALTNCYECGQQSSDNIIKYLHSLYGTEKIKVLFVCLGNICRSPAAEGIMRDIIAQHNDEANWEIDSAGTGRYHIGQLPDNRMRIHARRRGLELVHRCRQVCADDFHRFDIIIPMDASNESNLRGMSPTEETDAKIIPMARFVNMAHRYDHIPDPYYEGAEGFELVLDLLENGCTNLYDSITNHP